MGACSKQLLQKVCPQFSTSFHGKVKFIATGCSEINACGTRLGSA